ncbi:gibberellin-regulated protein 2-like [Triticum dicoccoides]|uniref:gibberellin-regulated protein 2-like n=1 Tax=Triticum dicoccoides TaxID=85692 RepID=UPI0018917019|nr:gibberellin-regulated protein 2-like [Triticum dicoccoides]
MASASIAPPLLLFVAVLAVTLAAATVAADAHQRAPGADGDDRQLMAAGGGVGRTLLGIDCPKACEARCGRNWKNEMCNKLCNICCGKCSCVPSGTGQDTRNECPCYANMKNTKNGKPKCP